MVGTWHPKRDVALHAVQPNLNILKGVVQRVPQVQRAGNVGWWNDDGERLLALVDVRIEAAVLKPRVIDFCSAGGEIESIGNLVGFSVHICWIWV